MTNVLYSILLAKRKLHAAFNATWLRAMGMTIGHRVMIDPSLWVVEPSKIIVENDCEIRRGVIMIAGSSHSVGIHLGRGVHLHQHAYLDAYGGFIRLGEGVRIGHYSIIAGHGGVSFGPYSGVAGHSYVIAANHSFRDSGIPHVHQPETKKGIVVGSNVWGGSGVIILDGVKIGDNCVIGAGAVVRRNIPDNSVVLGNPARVAYRFGLDSMRTPESR